MDSVRDIDLKTDLDSLLDRVENGEVITVTRDGRPVARLVHAEPMFDQGAAKAAMERILEIGRSQTLGGVAIKDLINEGRKY